MTKNLETALDDLRRIESAALSLRSRYGHDAATKAQQFHKQAAALQWEADRIFWSDVLDALVIQNEETRLEAA